LKAIILFVTDEPAFFRAARLATHEFQVLFMSVT